MKNILTVILTLLSGTFSYGQVGIGTNTPDASSILDLSSANKGILIPRVALNSNTDVTTIPLPAPGLLIYNTGVAALTTKGFMYWNGNEWRTLNNSSTVNPTISGITCSSASLNPSTYSQGIPYSGTMSIPYSGGNGGTYNAGTPIPSTGVTGLNATLQAGTLAIGNGSLIYSVSGTPSQSSPNIAAFSLPATLGAPGCIAQVGTGDYLQIGTTITGIYFMPNILPNGTTLSSYLATLIPAQSPPNIDGLRMDLVKVDGNFYDPRVYNASATSKLVSYTEFAATVNERESVINTTIPSGGFVAVDFNDITYWNTTNAETIDVQLQVQINATTYRWYQMQWWCMEIGSNKVIFLTLTRKA